MSSKRTASGRSWRATRKRCTDPAIAWMWHSIRDIRANPGRHDSIARAGRLFRRHQVRVPAGPPSSIEITGIWHWGQGTAMAWPRDPNPLAWLIGTVDGKGNVTLRPADEMRQGQSCKSPQKCSPAVLATGNTLHHQDNNYPADPSL
jgi:hypothetical protein